MSRQEALEALKLLRKLPYGEYFESGGPAGVARLDSILHLTECRYRWGPLRRERLRS